jgi:hypothetical protein
MLNTHAQVSEFPTGRRLRSQRRLRGLTVAQLARQLALHPATLRALEDRGRVIPPGWYAALERESFHVPRVPWPLDLRAYTGTELAHDLRRTPGLRHSLAWLCRQLDVPEATLRATLRQDLGVPPDWLLKLAELGASVPSEVHVALQQAQRPAVQTLGLDERRQDPVGAATRAEETAKPMTPEESPPSRPAELDAQHFSLSWSEEGGLSLAVSPALLRDMQLHLRAVLHELVRSPWFAEAAARPQ